MPGLKEHRDGLALAVANLKGEKTGWFQRAVSVGDETAVEVETVGAGEEGGCGLVVSDLGVKAGAVAIGDVGRVADDGVEAGGAFGVRFVVGQGREEVGLEKMDTVGHVMFAGVGGGYGKSFGGDVEGGDVSMGEMGGESDCDGSGAGADVGDLQGLIGWQAVEDGFNEELCFGAGDQDGWSDFEEEAVKLLLAGDVLDGLVVQAAADGVCIGGLLLCCELAHGMGEEGDTGNLQGVEEQEFGVAAGLIAEMLACGELCSGFDEGLRESHAGRYLDRGWVESGTVGRMVELAAKRW